MQIRKILIYSILFMSFSFAGFAQSEIDSLKKVEAGLPEDTNKVNTLIKISEKYRSSSNDSSLYYAKQAKILAVEIDYPKGLGYALKSEGLIYNIRGEMAKAFITWREALKVFEENNIKAGAANMLNNMGVISYNQGNEVEALDYYLRSLKVAEEIQDTHRIATALTNIGGVYSNKKETYDKSLEYHQKALQVATLSQDLELIGGSNANIGDIYVSMYREATKKTEYLDSALSYLMKARKLYKGMPNLPYAFNIIGKVYLWKKDYALSIKYRQLAIDTAKIYESKLDMAQAWLGIAETDTAMNDYKAAIEAYNEAEKLFKEISLEDAHDLKYVYEGLSSSYYNLNDLRNAFSNLKSLLNLKEKLYDLDIIRKTSVGIFQYETVKTQAEIELQKAAVSRQKLIRNGFIGGFAIVLMFAGVFLAQRNRINKEKKRSDELLLNILPEETAEELKLTGSAKAKSFDLVSVLFTDFKNFTQASERLSPEELVQEINHCYSEFDRIITKYGLEKIKTIGDAYMCAGGLPVPNTTHSVDIVKAGLEMVRFIAKNKQEREAKGLPFFELRCGIHTGPVVAGIVGIKKFAYDIWGDTVNTASRMESSGEVGRVNISGETYELIKNRFKCIHRGKVKAKNKGEIDMYFVEDVAEVNTTHTKPPLALADIS
jgi:adenylate cyclase